MAKFPNWQRSEQEKVSGLPPFYAGADGRTKYPWLRCSTSGTIQEAGDCPLSLLSLSFSKNHNPKGKQ